MYYWKMSLDEVLDLTAHQLSFLEHSAADINKKLNKK